MATSNISKEIKPYMFEPRSTDEVPNEVLSPVGEMPQVSRSGMNVSEWLVT